jgi:hypothetical protein
MKTCFTLVSITLLFIGAGLESRSTRDNVDPLPVEAAKICKWVGEVFLSLCW